MQDKAKVLEFITPKTAKYEGFSAVVYKCPAGYNTIGYGRNIESNPLRESEKKQLEADGSVREVIAMSWLKEELAKTYDYLTNRFAWFKNLDNFRAAAIVDMNYNLGLRGFANFKKAIAALEKGNYAEAAKECKNSKWFLQVKNRAVEICDLIENGEGAKCIK